ncbi:unnamed protein product [Paramecium pentaurelia]|uniref:Uncharacterized protein n=1 Tax=Paramecium pentaurelia TaxID=43138 RepID=A0A8S1WGQ6_9CILI|nr:unnamed protein product [Paramecium pentaurelia]
MKLQKLKTQRRNREEIKSVNLLSLSIIQYPKQSNSMNNKINSLQIPISKTINIKTDIEFNIDEILRQMINELFNEIMTSYKSNLQLFIDRSEVIQKHY